MKVKFVMNCLAWLCMAFALNGQAAADSDTPCTHDAALEMGAFLHEKFDLNSWKSQGAQKLTDEEVAKRRDILFELMDASDATLRGDDTEACRRYRKIAAEQGVELP